MRARRTDASVGSFSISSTASGFATRAAQRRCTSGSRSRNGETSESFAARLLEHGVLVTPGSFLGPSGEGYVRFALVPTEEECIRAIEILEALL